MEILSHKLIGRQNQNAIGQQTRVSRALASFSKIASAIVVLIGCIVIAGWIFDISLLKSILPGLVTMKANTAIGFILGGTSLWLYHLENRQKLRIAQICAIAVIIIGLLTLIQYGFKLDLGIDQLLFKESLGAVQTLTPGRMAPNTALNFILAGSALLLLSIPRLNYIPTQAFSLVAFLIASLGLLGYLYGNAKFYNPGLSTAMALHTSIAFLLLCLGILFANPDRGLISVLTKANAGGIMARQLLPVAILIPPILGWLILSIYRSKFYTAEMGISLLGILNVIVFSIIIWWNGTNLSAIDEQRLQTEAALKQAFVELKNRSETQEKIASRLAISLNEISVTMDELRESSRATAEQTEYTATGARQALNLSDRGSIAVQQTLEGMTALEEKVKAIANSIGLLKQKTSQIRNISSLVSDLANQTNMLALNAAVESARVGEYGLGFRVIATEIRKLAEKSKQSADNINNLITDIDKATSLTVTATNEGIKTVTTGVKIAAHTAEAFNGVVEAINQIFVNNQQIALNANQQAVAIEQVVVAMNTLKVEL